MKRLLALAALAAGTAAAQQAPIVEVDVQPASVIVGESVRVRVTVLVPTWFATPPVYPDFEIANAVTTLPADSSFPTSRRIRGQTWSGIVRDYRIVPLAAATYRQDGTTIRVAVANPGSEAEVREVAVPAIEFSATVPAGAEGLDPYLAGTKLELERTMDTPEGKLEPGDAVVLRYEARLDGLPAVFLPPLAPDIDADGLAVYTDEPRIDDGPPAVRRETVTLVFEAGGEYAVPSVSLSYWNTDSDTVETVTVDNLALTVAGPAVQSEHPSARGPAASLWKLAAAAALLLLIVLLVRHALPGIRQRQRQARERRLASEAHAFHLLERALRTGRPDNAYALLVDWLAKLAPSMDSRGFAAQYGDALLVECIEQLIAARYAGERQERNIRGLLRSLTTARRRYIRAHERSGEAELAPLNPR